MTTLSSKGRLRKLWSGMVRRNISYMIYFGILLFVLYPLLYIQYIFGADRHFSDGMGQLVSQSAPHVTFGSVVVLFAAILGMTLVMGLTHFSYLHSKKAVDVYHGLPVARHTMMLAKIFAAFTEVMIPTAVNFLIVMAAGCIKQGMDPSFPSLVLPILLDLLFWAVVVFAVLVVIAFVAVQVGSVFDNLLFSCELLAVLPVAMLLSLFLCETQLRGFYVEMDNFLWIFYLSPVSLMMYHYGYGEEGISSPEYLQGLAVMAVWLVLSLLLLWITARLYRKRPSELAESTVTGSVLSRVGVLAATYIGGTFASFLFTDLFGFAGGGPVKFVLWTFIFSILIFVLAYIILNRGFKGFRKAILPGVLTVGIITGFAIVLTTGGFGFETRVPRLENVQSVTVNYRGRSSGAGCFDASTKREWEDSNVPGVINYSYQSYNDVTLEEDQAIAAVQRLHEDMAGADQERDDYLYVGPIDHYWTSNIMITYQLDNGREMHREYSGSETNNIAEDLLVLENTREFKEKTHPVFNVSAEQYASFTVLDAFGANVAVLENTAQMQQLLDALAEDMLAEDVTALKDSTVLAPCVIRFNEFTDIGNMNLQEDYWYGGEAMVLPGYKNTLAVLNSLGMDLDTGAAPVGAAVKLRVVPEIYHPTYNGSPIDMIDFEGMSYWIQDLNYSFGGLENLIQVEDTADREELFSHAFNMGMTEGLGSLTAVLYDAEDNPVGAFLVRYIDLPEAVKLQVPEWIRDQEESLYLDVTPKAVSIGGAETTEEMVAAAEVIANSSAY